MIFRLFRLNLQRVALRKESVDRNSGLMSVVRFATVALRKESVDRNKVIKIDKILDFVALRKESVDRNTSKAKPRILFGCRSPQGERG